MGKPRRFSRKHTSHRGRMGKWKPEDREKRKMSIDADTRKLRTPGFPVSLFFLLFFVVEDTRGRLAISSSGSVNRNNDRPRIGRRLFQIKFYEKFWTWFLWNVQNCYSNVRYGEGIVTKFNRAIVVANSFEEAHIVYRNNSWHEPPARPQATRQLRYTRIKTNVVANSFALLSPNVSNFHVTLDLEFKFSDVDVLSLNNFERWYTF